MARSFGVVIPSRLDLVLRATLLTGALLLAGCAATPPKPLVDHCTPWRPIYPSQQDVLTDGTAKAIRDHDHTGAKLCGWKPRKVQP